MTKKYTKQGGKLVARDPETSLPIVENNEVVAAKIPWNNNQETWRQFLSKMTNGSKDLLVQQLNIANGQPVTITKPDGSTTQESPDLEMIIQVRKDLLDRMNGKPVPESELLKAEGQAKAYDIYETLNEEQLKNLVEGRAIISANGEYIELTKELEE